MVPVIALTFGWCSSPVTAISTRNIQSVVDAVGIINTLHSDRHRSIDWSQSSGIANQTDCPSLTNIAPYKNILLGECRTSKPRQGVVGKDEVEGLVFG